MKTVVTLFLLVVGAMPFLAADEIREVSREYNERLDATIERIEPRPVETVRALNPSKEEVCFAQILFSESKDRTHWVKLGWSVRNRVDMKFRGDDYCSVAHWRGQFSAISYKSDPSHELVMNIHKSYLDGSISILNKAVWEDAIKIGRSIMNADPVLNPIPEAVYFFHVPTAVAGNIKWPNWAKGVPADYVIRREDSKEVKWAFYKKDTVG